MSPCHDKVTRQAWTITFRNKQTPAGELSRAHKAFVCLQARHLLCLQTRHLLCQQTRYLLCQQTRHLWSPKTSLLHCPHRGGREAAAPVWPMPTGCLGRPQMSCLLTQQMFCQLIQQMSCPQTRQMACLHPVQVGEAWDWSTECVWVRL